MAKRDRHRRDVGSDCGDESSDSLEEITADDFKRRDVRDTARSRAARVWMDCEMGTERECVDRLSMSNFGCVDGLENKLVGLELMPMTAGDLTRSNGNVDGNDEEDNVDLVIDVSSQELDGEKEDGESEEGEVESVNVQVRLNDEIVDDRILNKIDKEVVDAHGDKLEEDVTEKEFIEIESEDSSEPDKNVSFVLEELQTITAEVAESSFDAVCSKLHKCFESMKTMFQRVERENVVLIALVHQAFSSTKIVYSVLNSKNLIKMEKNKELFSRLLIHIKNNYSILLLPKRVNEIDELLKLLVFEDDNTEKELSQSGRNINGQSLGSVVPFILDPSPVNILGSNDGRAGLHKLDVKSSMAGFSPLLDLHADHDEGSLPSPTRGNPSQIPTSKTVGYGLSETASSPAVTRNVEAEVGRNPSQIPTSKTVGYGLSETSSSPAVIRNVEAEVDRNQFYVTEALKAVSSYEQKYGRISLTESPTPSDECNDNDDDDSYAEISTSVTNGPAAPDALGQFQSLNTNSSSTKITMSDQDDPVNNIPGQVRVNKPALKPPSKSRDPRLRFLKPEISGALKPSKFVAGMPDSRDIGPVEGLINDKKQKAADDSIMHDYALKRQRDGFYSTEDCHMQCNSSGWLEDRNLVSSQSGKQQQTVDNLRATTNTSSVDVLPALVSCGATNPVQPNEAGTVALVTSRMPSQANSLNLNNNVGRQMKPRDPRRIRYNNRIVKENENLDSEQMKNGVPLSNAPRSTCGSKLLASIEQVTVEQSNCSPCQSISKPEMNRHPTKNLKQLADSDEPKIASAGTSQGSDIDNLQPANLWGDVDHLLEGYDDNQKATIQRERARRIDEQNKMFAARKLCLVLDLDHTLLNSAKFVEVDPAHEEILRMKEVSDSEKPLRHLFRLQHMGMWTKMRPGVWNFLEKASKLYELHLYTMGNKLYATEMAKLLDPTGTLFSGRVMSRGDDSDSMDGDERTPKSKDLEGVLGMESAVVIIDDSVRVWPHNKHNLIVVERYTYFPCSRRQFGLLGPSLLEIDRDERPEDGTLASVLAVTERIHQRFFSHVSLNEVDVRNILAYEKQKILGGCKIVFSRIIPVTDKKPHLHPLWQMAEQFGAVCTTVCDGTVTHVVANSLGTEKVNWAFKKKKFVVHPGWLEASALLYRRANEHDFAVTQLS